MATRFPASRHLGQSTRKFFNSLRHRLTVNKLPIAAAIDEPGFAQNLQMVRNRGGRNAAHRNDLAATHLLAAGNGFKDAQARLIAKRFRDFLDLRPVHL